MLIWLLGPYRWHNAEAIIRSVSLLSWSTLFHNLTKAKVYVPTLESTTSTFAANLHGWPKTLFQSTIRSPARLGPALFLPAVLILFLRERLQS